MPYAYRDADSTTYFQQSDWEGTQRVLTNYAGSVSSVYKSNPFGALALSSASHEATRNSDWMASIGQLNRTPATF
jgi:hypothetical protein